METFMALYKQNLETAVTTHPELYHWPVANVPYVAARMEAAIWAGTYSKDGLGFKLTCKALKIPYTYKAINAFCLGGK